MFNTTYKLYFVNIPIRNNVLVEIALPTLFETLHT